jgi:HK97 gp10 family phage protein
MGSFSAKMGDLARITNKIRNEYHKQVSDTLYRKMKQATEMIYATAHSRRERLVNAKGEKVSIPDISGMQYLHNDRFKTVTAKNPKAYAGAQKGMTGVPVKTGTLRSTIQRKVDRTDRKVTGKIWTDGGAPYDKYIEFGTSKMAPRSFMGSALYMHKNDIKKIFKKKSS